MRLIGIAGYSGSGKTTLIKKLIPLLTDSGLRVATVKHAHHTFDIDRPGKDSHEHRRAGAAQVLISSRTRWALMNENRDRAEPKLPFLLAQLSGIDFVLIEGFKGEAHPKVGVVRTNGANHPRDRLSHGVPNLVALACDTPQKLTDRPDGIPCWDLNRPETWVGQMTDLSANLHTVRWERTP